jgi:hypothetical protein
LGPTSTASSNLKIHGGAAATARRRRRAIHFHFLAVARAITAVLLSIFEVEAVRKYKKFPEPLLRTSKSDDDSDLRFFALASPDFRF